MSRLTRDGTAKPVSRDQILRRVRGQGNIHFLPCSADHEQNWQPYPVDPYYIIICDDHTYNPREQKQAVLATTGTVIVLLI